eukprot:EG_transcript_22092
MNEYPKSAIPKLAILKLAIPKFPPAKLDTCPGGGVGSLSGAPVGRESGFAATTPAETLSCRPVSLAPLSLQPPELPKHFSVGVSTLNELGILYTQRQPFDLSLLFTMLARPTAHQPHRPSDP